MEEEKILEKYKLTEKDHDFYYDIIKRVYIAGKTPEKTPIAVIIGGQTGAGKSGIIGHSLKMFDDNNVIIINSDEIKPFHPKSEEIAKEYPQLYTKITDQESNTWTSKLFEELRRDGYNIIFEGTMKNNRIADESIVELEDLGYMVLVRGIATCDLESRISILERYEGQVAKKGWGRLVVPEHHNQTYEGMPKTIKYIEENGRYDILEIYTRGEKIDRPKMIYSKHNEKTVEKIQRAIDGRREVSKFSQSFGYTSADAAVLGARNEGYERVLPTTKKRVKNILDSMNKREASDDEKRMVMDILEMIDDITKKKPNAIKILRDELNFAQAKIKKISELRKNNEEDIIR